MWRERVENPAQSHLAVADLQRSLQVQLRHDHSERWTSRVLRVCAEWQLNSSNFRGRLRACSNRPQIREKARNFESKGALDFTYHHRPLPFSDDSPQPSSQSRAVIGPSFPEFRWLLPGQVSSPGLNRRWPILRYLQNTSRAQADSGVATVTPLLSDYSPTFSLLKSPTPVSAR